MKLLAMFLLIGISAFSAAADMLPSDSNISGPKYINILAWEDGLKVRYPDLVTLVPYGLSEQGRPLQLILVRKYKKGIRHPTLLMSGSTHGSEYLHIEDRLPEKMLEKSRGNGPVARFLDTGGAFVFIPIVNPDGYESHQRENSHGVDLNRDWDLDIAKYKGFKEKETRSLARTLDTLALEEQLNYSITVDYHCCSGALLYPWSYDKAPALSKEQTRQFKAVGALATAHLPVTLGTTDHLLGYSPLGTTKDYYYSRYGSLAFTYEGMANSESRDLQKHLAWWEDMARWMLGTKTPVLFAQSNEPLSAGVGPAD